MATANSRRNTNALKSDLYTTPHWATNALLSREKFEGVFCDAGCGKGDISKVLHATGHEAVGVDLYDWGWGTTGINFLEHQTKYPNVISNPPFTLLGDFIKHGLEIASNKVAIFARINALETLGRYNSIYKDNPPTKVYLFSNRVKCLKGGHDDGDSSAVLYCWIVWDKGHNDWDLGANRPTQLLWIDDQAPKNEKPKFDVNAPALHISDVRTLLDETLATFRSTFASDDVERKHIVSVSGGKDSDCAYAIANIATEGDFEAIFCNTDNEHEETLAFVRDLHNNVGNGAPRVTELKAKFTEAQFQARREKIVKNWSKPYTISQGIRKGQVIPPMTDKQIYDALEATQMTDNAMLNSMLLHGAMPSRQSRFCTEDLKIDVATNQILLPLLAEFDGEIINWSGVRAQESEERKNYKWVSEDPRGDGFLFTFLPVHKWLIQDVFALHKYLGFKPNPLYMRGAARVGCWPCIMSCKSEIREIVSTTPEKIVQLREWEIQVAKVSRYTIWQKSLTDGQYDLSFLPQRVKAGQNVHDMVNWAMTDRGGDDIEYTGADMNCKIGDHIFCE